MKQLLDGPWKGKTVVLVGDSINNLVYHAAVRPLTGGWGRLLRHAAVVRGGQGVRGDPQRVARRAGGQGSVRLGSVCSGGAAHSACSVDAYSSTLARLTVKDNTEMQGSMWMAGPPGDPSIVHGSGTLIVPKGWHKWKESDMAGLMQLADIIIVNYGLHYQNNMSEYQEAMPQMLAQLEAFAEQPGKAALFRETNVEHVNVDEQRDFYEVCTCSAAFLCPLTRLADGGGASQLQRGFRLLLQAAAARGEVDRPDDE